MAVNDNNEIEIRKDDFADALGWALREYLRENLTDPESGSRTDGDKFVWFNDPKSVLDKDGHDLPFIAISKTRGGYSRDLGHDGMGSRKMQPYNIQLVYDTPDHADLIDKACQLISEIKNQTGAGPDYGYDLSVVHDTEMTSQPNDRTNYADHRFQEQAAEAAIQATYGG